MPGADEFKDYKPAGSRRSLDVTGFDPAAKLRQIEKGPAETAGPKSLNRQNLIDRALDGLPPEKQQLREKVIEALQTVYDPELPVNLYDLGLIYKLEIDDAHHVYCEMTLTAPACPVAGTLPGEVEKAIAGVDGVAGAKVELVWEPRWGKQMMSEVALLELGLM
jgi:FeS assembly SUF system protein